MTGIGEEVAAFRSLLREKAEPRSPELEGLFVDFVETIERRRILVIRCSDGRVLDTRPMDARKARREETDGNASYSGYQIIEIGLGVVGAGYTKLQCLKAECGFILSFTNAASDKTIEACLGAHRLSCFMSLCAWCESEAGRIATAGLSHGICDEHSKKVLAERRVKTTHRTA